MRYRILEEGEIVEATDECDACADGWRDDARWEPVPPHMVGLAAGNPAYPAHTKYRRATSPNASRSAASASYKDQVAEQERFDLLVAIRMERPGETRDSAISWAANMVQLKVPNASRSAGSAWINSNRGP